MATVVLQVVGAAIGGALGGPAGAAFGRALGGVAGYALDQQLFSKDQVVRGGRLENSSYLASNEGAPIPRAYGRVRLGGQIIWATRFEEHRKVKKRKGKGGPGVTSETYRYFANFAVGICEGEISHIGRIWADGKEIDQTSLTIRKYFGSEDQSPDPLIEALQGAGSTPGFRGTAYAVFEDFPLADYGNRVPQISFEIIRSVGKLETGISSVTLIPGATEFGYSPDEKKTSHRGNVISENRHTKIAQSDWQASLDELQALCPNLISVALVVAWFGTDIRAGNCKIEPRCVHGDLNRSQWSVAGLTRDTANLVSTFEGEPAYGGTPSDASLLAAIADLKARGLEVMFYPFIMMDIPPDNQLPNPQGSGFQPPYPWRGLISCDPAIGAVATADQTAAARIQIDAFAGAAVHTDFSASGQEVTYTGPNEWSYRRMILHYAKLCQLAGGVERFLIGSELPGLTTVRDAHNAFPFVETLVDIAAQVRSVVGSQTLISYAADWTEYFGYRPDNPTNDVHFHLDPLWASPNIDAIAIDNYMPLSDWQISGDPIDDQTPSDRSLEYLKSNISGGEGHDWYYASSQDRLNGNRTPITDGLGEPWVWAYKRIAEWWGNLHHERISGVRSTQPTQWEPGSKPVWFTEIGCPAVNRGANQPNVFVDQKSSQSNLPWFSSGGRDDLILRRYHQAHLEFWSQNGNAPNPLSTHQGDMNGKPMIDPRDIFHWAWDARPFPAFPHDLNTWSDGLNWYRGHWLNGRLGSCPLDELLQSIFADNDAPLPECSLDGHVEGYVISGEAPVRQSIETITAVSNISVMQSEGNLVFIGKSYRDEIRLDSDNLIQEDDGPQLIQSVEPVISLPRQITLAHGELASEFETVTTSSRRLETDSDRQISMEYPAVIARDQALTTMQSRLVDSWTGRKSFKFTVSQKHMGIEPGDSVRIDDGERLKILSVTAGAGLEMEAVAEDRFEEPARWQLPAHTNAGSFTDIGKPFVLLMNLPLRQGELEPAPAMYAAVSAKPWPGSLAVYASPTNNGFEYLTGIDEPSVIGELINDLPQGPVGRWDHSNSLLLRTTSHGVGFGSKQNELVFAGANSLAVGSEANGWEILQFSKAELVSENQWRLSGLLRGQLGTDPEMHSGAIAGDHAVLLDGSPTALDLGPAQLGLTLNWRIGPASRDYASDDYVEIEQTCVGFSKRPLSPVHLSVSRNQDGLQFSWIRRSRLNADNWQVSQVPLDFARERYQVEIFDSNSEQIRRFETTAPTALYTTTDQLTDFGSLNNPFSIVVAQIGNDGLTGPGTSLHVEL